MDITEPGVAIAALLDRGGECGMSLSSALEVRRWVDDFQRRVRDYRVGSSEPQEPPVGELWEQVSPELDKALATYNRKESPDTPESSWFPGRTTKAGCQRDLDAILDTVLAVLGACGAASYRQRIRNLQADNSTSQSRIVQYRELTLSAPAEGSQTFVEGLLGSSQESLKDNIADETDRIGERNRQIDSLKAGFWEHLKRIGLNVSRETADSFLLPVEDDIVSMAAVILRWQAIFKRCRLTEPADWVAVCKENAGLRYVEDILKAPEVSIPLESPIRIRLLCGCVRDAIMAANYLDKLGNVKSAVCHRPDCGVVYDLVSKHARKFCTPECAHLDAVRRSRMRKAGAQHVDL